MSGFDLIHERWIPVTTGGATADVSLLEALTRAHEIDGLALDDPLQAAAVFRQVLLPVVLHALGPPRTGGEWTDWWESGRLDGERIEVYLAGYADRFDLFHPDRPFAQVAGLRTAKDDTRPVSLLMPAVATGNNVPLFTARTEAEPPALTPAEAARAVLAAHCWDTAAIKSGAVGDPAASAGKTTGNPTGPLGQLGVIVPMGATLAETLLLNLPIVPQGLRREDRPQWAAEPHTAEWRTRPAAGLLDLLTWQSRRIRLVREPGTDEIRRVVLAAGDRLDHVPDDEPHTAWRGDDKPSANQRPQRPIRHQPGKSAWRGLTSLLATGAPTAKGESSSLLMTQLGSLRADGLVPADVRLQVLTVGVAYGNQSAVVEDVLSDLIPLPITALPADSPVRELLLQVVDEAEQLRDAANRLGDDLRRATGADKLPWDKGLRLGDGLVHEFTGTVRRMLAGLQRQPGRVDETLRAWRQDARRLALEVVSPVLDAAPPAAFLGRQHGDTFTHRPATAEARFRRRLTEILGPPARTTNTGDRP